MATENVIIGSVKIFEQLFCEAFLDPGDGVLVFSPYFPTYLPNISRRGARVWFSDSLSSNRFRPRLDEIERFLRDDPHPKAIFLNSPHNPTGGVATAEDLRGLADLIRGRNVCYSVTNRTIRWYGVAVIARRWLSPACSTNAWPRTRSANPTA